MCKSSGCLPFTLNSYLFPWVIARYGYRKENITIILFTNKRGHYEQSIFHQRMCLSHEPAKVQGLKELMTDAFCDYLFSSVTYHRFSQ